MRTVGGSRPRGHIEVYIRQVICHYKPRISNIVPRKRRAKGYCVHFRDIGRRGIGQGATLNHHEMNTAADSGDPPFLDPCQTGYYSSSRSSEVTRLDPIPINPMVDELSVNLESHSALTMLRSMKCTELWHSWRSRTDKLSKCSVQ